ncbi:virulence RhuM family protein [Zavarzinia compransoris]|nr:virulence RhuM family protein [Zavarzinia marina]
MAGRADAAAPDMGLTNWPKDNIRKADVGISKNYLADAEVRELNRLTSIMLDIFEDQLDLGRLVVMADATRLLDRQLRDLGRSVLSGGGSIGIETARRHAETQYEAFDEQRKALRRADADRAIEELRAADKALPKSRRPRPKN